MDLYLLLQIALLSKHSSWEQKVAFSNHVSFITLLYYNQEDTLGLINKKKLRSKHQQLTSFQNIGLWVLW